MARNLVKEAESVPTPTPEKKEEEIPKVAVNQVEAIIINRLDILTALVVEGFRQCGVKYEEAKEEKPKEK